MPIQRLLTHEDSWVSKICIESKKSLEFQLYNKQAKLK